MKLTMTRVLTPLAALAITFGVQAAAVSTDGFEAETSTVPGSRTGWSFTAGQDNAADASAVTAYGEAAKPSNLPDDFNAAGDYFLKLSTEDGTLFRNVNGEAVAASVPVGAGLYIDTDVQFTLTDSTDRPTPVAADKFIIWLEADETAHTTNLCVYGGSYTYSAGTIARGNATVYNLSAQGVSIAPGSWHRLTVKAVADAATMTGDVALPGFLVYIDGTLMASDEYFFGGADTLSYLNDSDFVTATGATAWDLLAAKTFFPALTTALSGLEQIGFSGEGKIDNVAVTSVTPGFLPANRITLNWGSDVSTVAYTVNGQTTVLSTSGSVVTVDPDTTITIMKENITFANGRDYSKFTFGSLANATGIAIVTPIEENGEVTGITISSSTSGAGGVGSFTFDTFIDNSKVAVTLSLSGLRAVRQAGDLVSVAYATNGVTVTTYPGSSVPASIDVGSLDPGDTIAVTVTYAANSGWINSGWAGEAGTVTLSGTTFTVAAEPTASSATLTIAAIKPAAMVNGTAYETFADALAAATTAGTATIQLNDNITLDAASAIAANKNITIDLAGKTITVDVDEGVVAAVFSVDTDGTLTITNSTETVGAVVAGDASACIANAGTLNLQAGNFGGLISGGDIYVTGGAYTAEIAGATLPTGYSFQMLSGASTYIYGIELTSYDIAYFYGDTELLNIEPNAYTVEDTVVLTNEVDLGVVGVTFDGWTNAAGTVVTGWDAGDLTGNQIFYAKTAVLAPSVAEIVGGASYATLKAAVEAASAGDTVRVLADCTVSEPITFSAGITLTNDYTVTLATDYALRFANGTSAPVTFCGTGTFTWSSGSGSPFLVGNNEQENSSKMGYGITNTVAGSLVLDSGTFGSTKGSGNMVKVENGSFVMNGGSIDAACTRCVKADADAGSFTATVTINGGVVRNTAATPVALCASAESATGTATVTINGGDITGTFTTKAGGTYALTIPGSSTARFDRDQSDFCASGYETTLDNGWYVVTAVVSSGTEPGGTVGEYNTQADAEAAAAAATVAVPAAVSAIAGIDETAYKALFAGKVVAIDGGAKPYAVVIELTAAAATDLQAQANAGATNALANISARSITIAATPGLYYSIKSGATLDNMTESATRTLATGSEVQLDMPSLGTTGFYQVLINITDK